MNSRIKLDLPELEPGQDPPTKCPRCESVITEEAKPGHIGVRYACGSSYWPEVDWIRHEVSKQMYPVNSCSNPSMSAIVGVMLERKDDILDIIRAVSEAVSSDFREAIAMDDTGWGGTCEHSVADALEIATSGIEDHQEWLDKQSSVDTP